MALIRRMALNQKCIWCNITWDTNKKVIKKLNRLVLLLHTYSKVKFAIVWSVPRNTVEGK